MAAADVTLRLETNDPTKEVVILTATDGETYVSRKFASVLGGQATIYEDAGTLVLVPLSIAVSGGTVTIHGTGLSDLKVCLTLYGRK